MILIFLYVFILNFYAYQAPSGRTPLTSREFSNDSIKTNEVLDDMLEQANSNTGTGTGPGSTGTGNDDDDNSMVQIIENLKEHYSAFTNQMQTIDSRLNTGDLTDINEYGSSYGDDTDSVVNTCPYCNDIPEIYIPYGDPLDETFANKAGMAQSYMEELADSANTEEEKSFYKDEAIDYKNLREDYKKGDFFSVKTNEKYDSVVEDAAKELLVKSKLAIVIIEKNKKCKPEECKNMKESIAKLKVKNLERNFKRKINYASKVEMKYFSEHRGKNILFKDSTIDGLYASGTSLFRRIHRNYRIRYRAGLLL